VEFDIPEASDSRTKRKLLQTVVERWRQFKSDLTRKWALTADQDSVEDTVCEKYSISKEKWVQFCQTCRDPSWEVCSLSFNLFFKKVDVVILHSSNLKHYCLIFSGCAQEGTGHPEAEYCPPRFVSWGL